MVALVKYIHDMCGDEIRAIVPHSYLVRKLNSSMIVPESDLIAVLRQFNPWWQSQPLVGPFHEYLQRGGFPPMRLRALHGTAVETATFKHLATRDYRGEVAFAHLKGKKDNEEMLEVVKWTQIYDRIEQSIQKVGFLANILEGVSIKNV